MDLLETIKADYSKFPAAQTYSIYDENVFFQDPVYKFQGLAHYQKMIKFITTWFKFLKLDLHNITQSNDVITAQWTMSWDAPLPWKPRISVDGWSELKINANQKIISHVDYWHCSRLDVILQHLPSLKSKN